MGVVAVQSFKNLVTTYMGFAVGALNTLVLYVNFLSEEYYGLVGYLLSAATILMPLLAVGTYNSLVKFYTAYKGAEQDRFLTMMLGLPLLAIVPLAIVVLLFYDNVVGFFTTENELAGPYVFLVFLMGAAMAYFEVFYAWARVQLQSVFGNFMKEVFHRLCVTALLAMLYFELLTPHIFMYCLASVYLLRMLFMMGYAFRLRKPVLRFERPRAATSVIKYSLLIIIAGAIAVMILEIDMFMIGKMVPIENVAYYAVAIYIAAVISVPSRSMQQITSPLTANYLNERKYDELRLLYQKSSLTLFIVGGLIFVLIVCNIKQLYLLIDPAYSNGLMVVILISLAKLLENLMGNNNGIIYNSDYYRLVLVLGVFLVVGAILLNILFIPWLGINGAAIATFLATIGYCTAKIVVVYKKFGMLPFTRASGTVAIFLLVLVLLFYFWDLPSYPVLGIALKSLLIAGVYVGVIFKLHLSEEISNLIIRFIPKRKPRSK